MIWIESYHKEMERIFGEMATEIAQLPAPFNELGITLLNKCDPLRNAGHTNYISYLLPFWVNEQTKVMDEVCVDMAIGNVYAMLHFCLLDDIMDGDESFQGQSIRELIALGQLFHNLFIQRYQRHFPPESPLWAFYTRYVTDWATAVSKEDKQTADPRHSQSLARKSSPVKLGAIGLYLHANQIERIQEVEEAVDLTLATLQLADDWTDWREDLAIENSNGFLTLVRESLSLNPSIPLDEVTVKRVIYQQNILDSYSSLAEGYGYQLKAMSNLPKKLVLFHDYITDGLRKDASLAEETTKRLTAGGFSFFLSN
jgi:hypothetical protein